jgi:small-conductance mechanosensitive channel
MDSLLARFGLDDQAWVDPVIAFVIFGLAAFLSALSHYVVIPLAQRLSRHTETELDNLIFQAVRRPISLLIMVLGGYLAVVIPLDLPATQQDIVNALFTAAAIIAIILLIGRVLAVTLDWYIAGLDAARRGAGAHIIPMLRKLAVAGVYVIGGLLVLEALGISVSPLIAGLGLGGLAVALAIQPTLSSVFAGTYIMTEGVISPGDYIELQGGVAGYVIEVSWRSTRIRTWENNLVVIPNATFATTIFTNYGGPTPPVNVYLTCGVSYESDLVQVEAISRDVMEDLLDKDPNGVKEYGAWFGFESFGESNVIFWLFVQARDRLASFELQSALIRDLQQRFAKESIVINYPVRAVRFPDGTTPRPVVWQASTNAAQQPPRPIRTRLPADIRINEDSPDSPDIDAPG